MTVSPGARAEAIGFEYQGADGLSVNAAGDLVIDTAEGKLVDHRPYSYQVIDGKKVAVATQFVVDDSKQRYGFRLGRYDRSRPLVIDPGLVYSTYLGGSGDDYPLAVAVDGSGGVYATGRTTSLDFPDELAWIAALWEQGLVVRGGSERFGDTGIFVTKFTDGGMVWTTFLGLGEGRGVRVDGWGGIYVSGVAYPGTSLPAMASFGPPSEVNRAFVAKLYPNVQPGGGGASNANEAWVDGVTLGYAVTVGGTQPSEGHGVTVDNAGNAYVVGRTEAADFPTTTGAVQPLMQGPSDAFAFAVNASGSQLIYSTLLGGTGDDVARDVAVDGNGNAYVAGVTRSEDFPVTPGAWDLAAGGGSDGFVTRLNTSGSALVYSTYLGGAADDDIGSVALDTAGNAFVGGTTRSADFPTTVGAFQRAMRAAPDGLIAALDPAGSSLKHSTFVGGSSADGIARIAVNRFDDVYAFGTSRSTDFPTTVTAHSRTLAGGVAADAIVARFDRAGTLRYATYLGGDGSETAGGLAVDARGDAYVVGQVEANAAIPTFPAVPAPGGVNGYLAKLIPRESLSFNKPASASSVAGAGFTAGNAVDGDLTTAWSSEASDPQWIAIDLVSPLVIERVLWHWGPNYATDSEVQVSTDGAVWTIVGVVRNYRADVMFAPVLARYVRILGVTRATSEQGHSILELDVFAPLESAPAAALNAAPTASITSPADGSTFTLKVTSLNISFAVDAADSDGTVERVEFVVNGRLMGYKSEAPYSGIWSATAPGTYTLTARVFDNAGAGTISEGVTVTMLPSPPNASPVVALTSPSNGATFAPSSAITVTAHATDSDDGVVSVQFWANGTRLIGTDTTAPYTAQWSTSTTGDYQLTAIAFDTVQGSLSQPVNIRVKPPNVPPAVRLTSPPNGATFTAPFTTILAADASDSDGSVIRVNFLADGWFIGSDSSAPYTFEWSSTAGGSHLLTAEAVDSEGTYTVSAPVTVSVNAPTTITLTSPLDGASFVAGTPIALAATAAGNGLARVDFYVNGSRVVSDSTAPYSGAWSTNAVGTYTVSAQAIDGAGRTATSAPATVTVGKRGRK